MGESRSRPERGTSLLGTAPPSGGGAEWAATSADEADPSAFLSGLGRLGLRTFDRVAVHRGSFDSLGPADVWARVRLPLVDGVALTGQDRVLIAADSANGLSLSLPLERWHSIPPAMTATLLRPPAGEWVHLAGRTHLTDDGLGLAHADLFDPDGFIGEVAQPLLVQKRNPDNG